MKNEDGGVEVNLFSGNISTLEKALSYSSLKHKTTAQNISNADTPNYKSREVSFQKMLSDASGNSLTANKTDGRHIDFRPSENSGAVSVRRNVNYHHNGNNVDMDKEMSDLATNQIYYNALIERLNGKFSSLQMVIKGGK